MLTELGLSAFDSSQVSALDPLAAWDQVFLGASLLLSPGVGLNAFQYDALVPIIELDESLDSLLDSESLPLELNLQEHLLSFTNNSHTFTAPVSVPRLAAIASHSQAFRDQLTGWQETAPLVGESTNLTTINSSSLSSSSSLPPDQAGNSRQEARHLGFLDATPNNQTFFDGVGVGDKKDFYRFNLLSTSEFELALNGLSADANVFLEDASGNLVASSENEGTASESILETLESGIYYLLVRSDSEETNSTSYSLTLSAQFITSEVAVSDATVLISDPEYDQLGFQVTWQDLDGNLWLAPIESDTGNFILEETILLDTNLAPISLSQGGTGNGPEWVYSQENGSEIVYTKLIDGQFALGRAYLDISEWEVELIPGGENGFAPIGSNNPNNDNARINYFIGAPFNNLNLMAWQDLTQPNQGIIPYRPVFPGRWVEDEASLILTIKVDGLRQVAQYDVNTDTLNQLTFSATDKRKPHMWRAPEFDNELIFLAAEQDSQTSGGTTQLGIYQDINGQWTKIKTIYSPSSSQPLIDSAEPFVYNGKSYISLVTTSTNNSSDSNSSTQTEIWIVGIEPEADFFRQVSGDAAIVNRRDPESFITQEGVFIYYVANDQQGNRIVYQADTGLGLPDGAGNNLKDVRDIGLLDTTPQTFSDWVGVKDAKDLYRFELLNPSQFDLHLQGLSADANVFLADEKRNLIASSQNPSSTSESMTTTLTPGAYYVLVRSAQGANTDYELTLAIL